MITRVAALALVLIAGTAQAQERGRSVPTAQALRLLDRYAECVVRGTPERVRELMALQPNAPESVETVRGMAEQRNDCLGDGTLRASMPLMRGALAERIYRLDFPQAPEAGNPEAPFRGSGNADLFMNDVAGCMALRQPVVLHALVVSERGSPVEEQAVREIQPALSSCIPAGAQVRLSWQALRAFGADALYRARRQSQSAQSGTPTQAAGATR